MQEQHNYQTELKELSKIFQEMENAIIWCISEIRQLKTQIPCHTDEQKSKDSTPFQEVESDSN